MPAGYNQGAMYVRKMSVAATVAVGFAGSSGGDENDNEI